MRIGITYDLRDDYLAEGYNEEETAEFDRPDTIEAIEGALWELGYETDRIGHARQLAARLVAGSRWDLVFNIAEGLRGIGREAQVPALLDAFGVPYVFSDTLVLSLSLHKAMAKRAIRDLGIPTPDFALVETAEDIDAVSLPFPLFVKPVAEGTGKGVTAASKIHSTAQLAASCRELLARFGQPVLVETFLPGREFTVGMLGTGAKARAVGVLEIVLNPGAESEVYSYVNKEQCEELVEYKLVEGPIAEEAKKIALASWRGLGCRDAGRVDVRADAQGVINFLEVNPLAGLHPHHSDLPILCAQVGISYRELIGAIMDSALPRVDGEVGRSKPIKRLPPRLKAGNASSRKVAVLHGAVPPDAPQDEQDVLVEVEAVSEALRSLGREPVPVVFSLDLEETMAGLRRIGPAVVFNLVESVEGQDRLLHLAPAALDYLGLPYTGSPTEAMFLTANKLLTKRMLAGANIATPAWLSLDESGSPPAGGNGRHIVKSVWDHASIGLGEDCVVETGGAAELRRALQERAGRAKGALFAEAYIEGREFNLSLLAGPDGPETLPQAEMRFVDYPPGKLRLVDYTAKWVPDSFEYQHTQRGFDFPEEDKPLLETLSELAKRCWPLLGLSGYARVDFRVDAQGVPWVLEINANPCLSPDGGFVAAARQGGLDLAGVVERIVEAAMVRAGVGRRGGKPARRVRLKGLAHDPGSTRS